MKNVASRVLRGSIWIAAGRTLVNVLSFATTLVLARLLTPDDFGLWALSWTVLGIVNAVTDMALSQALIQHKSPTDDHYHTAWTLGVIRGAVLGVFVAALGPVMVLFYDDQRLIGIMITLGFATLLTGFANPRRVVLAKDLVFWQEFLLTAAQRLVVTFVSIGIALLFRSYWALFLGVIAGQITANILSYTAVPFKPKWKLTHTRELWSFSIWLTLSTAMNTVNWRFDQLLVGGLLGKETLGHYAVGDILAQTPTRETTAPLVKTLFPAFSRISSDSERLARAYQRSQALVTAIALPAGVGVALIAAPLVELVMGAKWAPAVPVIEALSVVFALQTLGSLVSPLSMALGDTKTLFRRSFLLFFVRLPIIVSGTVLFGLPGLIYSRCLTGLIGSAIDMSLVKKLIGVSVLDQLLANWRALAATALMAAAVLTVRTNLLAEASSLALIFVSATTGALTYFAVSAALWLIRRPMDGPEAELLTAIAKMRSRLGFVRV